MIQRRQSLFLFLAALLNAGVFYFNLYTFHTFATGADTIGVLRVVDHFPSLLMALVITLLPLVNIFLYVNRKRQIKISLVSILGVISFISLLLWRVNGVNTMVPPPTSGSYGVGAVLPVIAIVLLGLAIVRIRGDIKLVKSADRLR
jgi:hypothetical protein